jgi:F-type H+-transporting ATPase subunit epsilon
VNLRILLPFKIFARLENVSQIIVETLEGSFGLLAHRLDCVAALVPGILSYTTPDSGTTYLAIDRGLLVKRGDDVSISVRRAIRGASLSELHQAVLRDYLTLDAQEREMRSVVSKIESGLIGRIAELHHER